MLLRKMEAWIFFVISLKRKVNQLLMCSIMKRSERLFPSRERKKLLMQPWGNSETYLGDGECSPKTLSMSLKLKNLNTPAAPGVEAPHHLKTIGQEVALGAEDKGPQTKKDKKAPHQ